MADHWHYTSEGKRMEPVTAGELRQLAASGFLSPEDLVWKQGMTDWVAASSIPELFPKATAPAFTPAAATIEIEDPPATFEVARPARSRRPETDGDEDEDGPRPGRRRRTADESRRRRRPETANGPSLALILGLVGGGVFLLLVVVIAIAVAVGRSGPIGKYTATIQGGAIDTRDFTFKANTSYEFVLTSNPVSDVDIYLTDLNGQILQSGAFAAADNTIGPNGRIVWIFPFEGKFRVKVHNLGPALNVSTVNIRELGPGHGIEVHNLAGNPAINRPVPFRKMPMQPPILLPPPGPVGPAQATPDGRQQRKLPMLGGGQECEFTVTFPAARQVSIEVRTIEPNPDVDLFVFEVGGPRRFADQSIGPNCNLLFQAQAGRSYRFVVRNLTLGTIANSTITYTSP